MCWQARTHEKVGSIASDRSGMTVSNVGRSPATALTSTLTLKPLSSWDRAMQVWRGGGRAETNYRPMIPLFSPIIAAWVRSLAPNLERMDLTRLLTVSSVIDS